MGTFDTQTKAFMSVNTRFADLFNYVLFSGEEVIKPQDLEQQDTTEVLTHFSPASDKELQKHRDLMKKAVVMKDDSFCYMLLGLENQTGADLTMPVRNMLYDAIRYEKQLGDFKAAHKEETKQKGTAQSLTGSEFLSGLRADDKLLPIITLTLYWSDKEWEGPKKLSDMMVPCDSRIQPYFQDYNINLVEPDKLESFELFRTDVGDILAAIKASGSKEKLLELFEGNEHFRNLEPDAAKLLSTCTGIHINFSEQEDKIDMCKAIEDLKSEVYNEGKVIGHAEGKAIGHAEGKAIGHAEGKAAGRTEGRLEGLLEGRINSIIDALKDSPEELVQKVLHATDEEIAKAKALML